MTKTLLISITLLSATCSGVIKQKYMSSQDLFNNSPVEKLAEYINEDDTASLKTALKLANLEQINYKEKTFGATLLNWASYNEHLGSVKMLCQFGADPNIITHQGWSPLFSAIQFSRDSLSASILLESGANINECIRDSIKHTCLDNATCMAARSDLKIMKLLVSKGIDPNSRNLTLRYPSPLYAAFAGGNIDIVNYLIFDCHVDFDYPLYITISGQEIRICKLLREMTFELDSNEHKEKLRLIRFLKENGINYYDELVPDHVLKNYDENYIKNY